MQAQLQQQHRRLLLPPRMELLRRLQQRQMVPQVPPQHHLLLQPLGKFFLIQLRSLTPAISANKNKIQETLLLLHFPIPQRRPRTPASPRPLLLRLHLLHLPLLPLLLPPALLLQLPMWLPSRPRCLPLPRRRPASDSCATIRLKPARRRAPSRV